ncbi:MAG: TIGR03960 family B12-binding radical SAM protein [Clostridia bacterium]|nr:TIGR03960 family B12-binding radical SAM protein [Clostridia bacterium]
MDEKILEKILAKVQKPARYIGGEMYSTVKDKEKVDVRFCFGFPDTYEVGMSHLGIKILYSALNSAENVWCERVFAPLPDMEEQLRENNIPLFALESRDPISEFDFVGFTMQYELSYTNVVNMLDLGNIPVFAKDRDESHPLVIIGGPCVCNPEPICDFVDIVSLGEGEEALPELMELYAKCKKEGYNKAEFLKKAAQLDGFYVPSLYEITYKEDNTIEAITPTNNAPAKITKRVIKNLDNAHYPDKFILPYIEVIHDRAVQEIFRGCIRGCRFCQAGYIYRPVREKSANVINKQAKSICDCGGYEEVSLASLSTSDYTELQDLLVNMLEWTEKDCVNISLPSLRIDNFPKELMERIQSVRKSGLTFAPEAGTQRLRNVINKNITEENVLSTAMTAFAGGNTSVKLYFMIGLPTETEEDILGIGQLAHKVVDTFYRCPEKPKGKGVNVTVSVSSFVPKAFTPFQWEPQDDIDTIKEKQRKLVGGVTSKKIRVNWHDAETSFLEGVFARGDRRLSSVIYAAWKNGCKLDGWGEYFDYQKWQNAFDECHIDPTFYNCRKRDFNEILPWSHLDYGISEKFLKNENIKAHNEETTPHCREKCAGCGANKLGQCK